MQNNNSIPDSFDQTFGYSEDISEHYTKPDHPPAPPKAPDPIAESKTETLGDLFKRQWDSIFKAQHDDPQVAQVAPANGVNLAPPSSVSWQVPLNSQGVQVDVCDAHGQVKNSYTISDYISLPPGTILKVRSL